MQLNFWQGLRQRAYLVAIGLKRHMTLGIRVALIDGENVLLIRHTYLPGWQFPGGGVEPGETAEDAAARELMEESGLAVAGRPELFGLYLNHTPYTNRDHIALYVWRAHAVGRVFAANYEIAELGWFAMDALPAGTTGPTVARVKELREGLSPSARW